MHEQRNLLTYINHLLFSTKEPKFLVHFYFYTLAALIIFDGKEGVVFLDAEMRKKYIFNCQ